MKKITAQTKVFTKPFAGFESKNLLLTIGMISISIIAPALLAHTPQNQWITGIIVNLILFVSAQKLPLANAAMVAIFPSSIALIRGLLPAPMATIIPFIIFSNIALITVFRFINNRFNKITIAIIFSALIKFFILFSTSLFFANLLGSKLIIMLQWPQLATALAGGLIFAEGLKIFQKK